MKKIRSKSIVASMFLEAFITSSIIELAAVGSGLIDGVITSKMLGNFCMAAEGVAHPFFSIAGVVSGLLAVGMQTMISSNLARGQIKEMQKTYSLTVVVAVVVSAILTALLFFASENVAFILGARGNGASLLTEASLYLRGLSIGCIPMILCVILSCAIQIDSGSRLVQVSALVASLTDIIFDLVAVKAGLGMYGMGLATSVSYYFNFVFLLFHFIKKDRLIHFDFSGIEWKRLAQISKLGSEKASRRLTNVLRPMALNAIIISAGGAMGMSALSIRNNIGNFLEIPMTGIAGATALLSGISFGEKNAHGCREVGKVAHIFAVAYSAVVLAFIMIFVNPIASYYVPEAGELHDLVVFSMYTLALGLFTSTLIASRTSYLQASHQIKKTQILTFLNKLLVVVPCAFLCVNIWGSYGVIASFVISDLLILIFVFFYYRKPNSAKEMPIPTPEDYLALPEEFNIKPQDVIELTVVNEEEAALSAEQLQMFCAGHKMPHEKGIHASLCMEELLMNIIQIGFPLCKSICPIQIRVTISNGDIIMMIRDKCPKYDLKQRVQALDDNSDSESNLHIKLIAKTAKNIEYINLLETNTEIITI